MAKEAAHLEAERVNGTQILRLDVGFWETKFVLHRIGHFLKGRYVPRPQVVEHVAAELPVFLESGYGNHRDGRGRLPSPRENPMRPITGIVAVGFSPSLIFSPEPQGFMKVCRRP